jgi:hypothetical protein
MDQEKNPCNTLGIVLCVEISTTQEETNWVTRNKRSLENITEGSNFASSSLNINAIAGLDFDASDYDGEE